MCGIAGILSSKKIDRQQITVLTAKLAHRGPDAQGIYLNDSETVAFGHTRLSIIDLTAEANQPFFSSNRRYVIVYNGEIYNYRKVRKELELKGVQFRTNSDTEVIIEGFACWGSEIVSRLAGMFTLAIYDSREKKVFFARDRVGKKPLYYFFKDGLFAFASEIKSLLELNQVRKSVSIKKEVISTFLQLGYIPEPNTIYNHIYKFPAGHVATMGEGQDLLISSYWKVSEKIHDKIKSSEQEVKEHFKLRLEDAVSKRLISDVPLGVFLSGGIDSSLITALTVKLKLEKVKTFTIGFSDSRFDESSYARQIAGYLNTDHHNYYLPDKLIVEMIDSYLHHFHEPFADTSAIPTMLVSKLAKKEVSVVLTGDGGDELFLGYGAYTWAERLHNPLIKIFRPLLKEISRGIKSNKFNRLSHMFDKVEENKLRQHIFSQEQYLFSVNEINNQLLINPSNFDDWSYEDWKYKEVFSEGEKQALFDFQYYLKDDLLVKVDRASMYYGLECRSPLLDHNVVEYALNLPKHFKKRGNVSKVLLKEILYDIIPAEYFNRPKQGFSIPMQKWLRTDLNYLMGFLSKELIEQTAIFNFKFVNELRTRFEKGEDYLYNRLWALIIIQRFLTEKPVANTN